MFLKIKNLSSSILIMVCMFCVTSGIQATHIVGGDITYTCLGNDEYEITLTVRRDCQNGADDAPFDDPAIVGIFDIFGSLQTGLGTLGRLEMSYSGEDTITNQLIFDCGAVGEPVCVHQSIYKATIKLPYNKIGYCLSYQRCCRNLLLNNIQDPLETGTTYWTCLTAESMRECNSQPIFNEWPDVYICTGETLNFDHSATDPDGDVLVYKLCTPSQGATIDNPQPSTPSNPPYAEVVWANPYSLDDMLGGSPLTINSSTGVITAEPGTVGTFLVGICVEEYRNGVLLSTVRRDFEYNVRICTEPITADFDVEDNDCDGDNFVSFRNTTQGADSYTWYFDYPNNTLTSTDRNPSVTYPETGKYTVRLEATRDSDGCTTIVDKVVSTSSTELDADFTAEFESCDGGNFIRLTDISVDPTGLSCAVSWDWTIRSSVGVIRDSGNPAIIDVGNADEATIELEVTSSSGCVSTVSKTIDLTDIFPVGDFDYKLIGCTANGYLLEFSNTSSSTSAGATVSWTFDDNGSISTQMGDPVQIEVSGADLSVSMSVDRGSDCDTKADGVVEEKDYLPRLDIDNDLDDDCPDLGVVDVTFTGNLSGGNMMAAPVTYNWVVNGNASSDPTVTVSVQDGDVVDVQLSITYDNGCTITARDERVVAQFQPEIFVDEDINCDNTEVEIELTAGTNSNLPIESYTWDVDGVISSGPSLTIPLSGSGDVDVRLTVEFENGCTATFTETYNREEVAPMPEFEVEFVDCREDGILIRLVQINPDPNQRQVSWTVIDDVNGTRAYTDSPTVVLVNGDQVSVTIEVEYDNKCSITYTEVFDIDDIAENVNVDPSINYSVDFVECTDDGNGIFRFSADIGFSDCIDVESIVWEINGVTYMGTPVEVELPLGQDIDVKLTVSFTNGTVISTEDDGVTDTINTGDYFQDVEIRLDDKLDVRCDDTISVCVVNPSSNLVYEWSTDPNFNNIVGAGTELNGNGIIGREGTLYVRATDPNDPCVKGEASIDFDSDSVLITGGPFSGCEGDVLSDCFGNGNSSIAGDSIKWSINISVNDIVVSEIEDSCFTFVLPDDLDMSSVTIEVCATNCVTGCVTKETFEVDKMDAGPLDPFQVEPDSCGSLTWNFDIAPNMLTEFYWDFGDGNGVSNVAMPSHTYGMPGTYTVTLIDSSEVCPQLPVSRDINVGELVMVSIAADTIIYGDEETPVVPAVTSPDSLLTVTWCSLDGDSLFVGNPLEGFDPPLDTFTVIAKVVDEFGCADRDTVVLIRDTDNTEECLETVSITGPDGGIVCVGDTFQLCVVLGPECDEEDFSFLWEDNGCILDGQSTSKVTATADARKEFKVVVTSLTTGKDSMYTHVVDINNPMVSIDVDPININASGQPFVCLGQCIELTATGDPDCEYSWSTGETGQTIEVCPEEQTTYTVTCITDLGCEATSQVFVLDVVPPQCNEEDVFLPTAFSPNGDNVNDVLLVRSKFIRDMELLVQDRWGEEVFLSTTQANGWDGTYKGKELAPDVYSYCLKVTCINDTEYVKVGNVTLVK